MDPNTTLATLREACETVRKADQMESEEVDPINLAIRSELLTMVVYAMVEAIEDLDEWLSKGGFLPADWVGGKCRCWPTWPTTRTQPVE